MTKYLSLLFVIFILNSCDKLDELTKFDITYNSTVEIKATANLNLPFDIFTPDIETNSESEFEVNDTRKDLIEEIRLKQLELTITSPDDQNFSFLESIRVYIAAEGLPEIQIASKEDINSAVENILELDIEDIDIQEYIKKDNFNLRLNTVTDEVLTNDVIMNVKSVFFVDAKILGI